jgi:hypothetical protein
VEAESLGITSVSPEASKLEVLMSKTGEENSDLAQRETSLPFVISIFKIMISGIVTDINADNVILLSHKEEKLLMHATT